MSSKQVSVVNGKRARSSRNGHGLTVPALGPERGSNGVANGHRSGDRAAVAKRPLDAVPITEWDRLSPASRVEVEQLVEVLKAVKQGDFAARFPYTKDGILGRAGELLNDIIGMNEHMTGELVRVGKVVGQEGKMHERASVGPAKGAWASGMSSVNQLIADLVAPTNEVARVITAVARGDLSQKMVLEIEGRPVPRRVSAHRHDRQRDGRSAQLLRRRGHARREGSRQRGQARGSGRRQGRVRHLEGPHRQRQRPRRQPHRAGPQHRQGHHGRRQGRPVAEDHRRRQRARSSS